MTRRIHEVVRKQDGRPVSYFYIARIDGQWVDLAPYGNRLPPTP